MAQLGAIHRGEHSMIFGFVLLTFLTLSGFIHYSRLILMQIEAASHSFPNASEECPREIADYWFNEYPKQCLPPPTDHGAYFVPRGGAAPALCLFVQNLQDSRDIKLTHNNREYSCSYL